MAQAKRVVVTGGSGKLGRAAVTHLIDHGWQVAVLDKVRPSASPCPVIETDLTDFGQVSGALSAVDDRYRGVDAVVHLAAIPAPGLSPNATIFKNNVLSSYNVFQAAKQAGIRNIVWASSETVLGLPFETPPPYVPVDEDYAGRPETAYSLGKLVDEEVARQFCRWDPKLKMIGLRFSNVMEPEDYRRFPGFDEDASLRKWNLWGYIDARDGAQAIRKALEYKEPGMEVFIIANADTVMTRPNAELLAECFPDVPLRRPVGPNETLLSIEKARRLLGYEPEYSWRNSSALAAPA
ncbi:NAD-dependent epimerase/dehydratase family protein [Radicibacter daui]|uniref:NAD-dependent epimerase/dehydratase family protein n=1 Tax=Radicibacter daui TaxID=3064829 RepID=UPI00404699C7